MNVYVYREIYKDNLLVSEAAELIAGYIKNENIKCVYAPFDMWNRQRESGRSIADIFLSYNIPLSTAGKGRVNGWLCVKEFLKPANENGKTISRLQISKDCVNLISSLQKIKKDPVNPSDAAKNPHDITHAPDALRYFLVSLMTPPEPLNIKNEIPFEPLFTNEEKGDELSFDENIVESFYD